jgi:tetratricopeptide (TPR) repeat protein
VNQLGVVMRFLKLLALLLMVVPGAAHAEWLKAVSPSFIVYGNMKEAQLVEFTQKVERFDTFLRRKFGIAGESAPTRLPIYIVGMNTTVGTLANRSGPPSQSSWMKGFYRVGTHGPMAVMQQIRSDGKYDLDSDTVLFHEYVHHFMFQYFPGAYPAWFVEGFAEFYSTTEFDKEGKASYGRPAYHRAHDLIEARAVPLEKLIDAEVSKLSGTERLSLYARGWLLTHFLFSERDRKLQLDGYIRAVNAGADGLTAARQAFGDLAALDKALNAYLAKRTMTAMRQLDPTPVTDKIVVSVVEAGEAATITERIKARRRSNQEERPLLIASLEKARAKFPDSPAILTLLAQLHYEGEENAKALTFANAALAAAPDYPDALLYKGIAEMAELVRNDVVDVAGWKAARGFIAKANRADPENPYPLFHYFKSFKSQGIETPAIAGSGLAKAFSLTPQDWELRFAYTSHLIEQGKLADAKTLLKPVAFDPHGGSGAEYARRLMARIDRALKKGGTAKAFYEAGESEESIAPGSN